MAFKNKKGDGWYADWYENGRRHRKLFNKESNALLHESNMYKAIENESVGIIKILKVSFKEFSEIYLEEYSKLKTSYWTDFHYMKSLLAFFGSHFLSQISESDVNRYKVHRSKEVAPRTVNMCLSLLRGMFNKAKRHRIDGRVIFKGDNPVDGVEFYDEPSRTRYLTVEEIGNLYDQCKGELLALVKLAVNTGMRRGEMYALTWDDIDMDAQVIRIRRSKSGRPRAVPMTLGAIEAFNSLPKEKGAKVFKETHRNGFENAIDRAEIEDFHFHDLRHTFASHFIMRGGSQTALMELLGHSSLEMTNRYVTLSSEYHTRQISRMDSIWTPEQDSRKKESSQLANS